MSQTDEAQPRQIAIFDTSLRDGEQAPGFSMNTAQKLKLAHALRKLKVDVMEVGFAAASPARCCRSFSARSRRAFAFGTESATRPQRCARKRY